MRPSSTEHIAGDLMRLIGRVMQAKQDEFFGVIAELDLTIPQMRALFVLGEADQDHALALTELAPRMGLSVAAAGRAVDGLVRGGLVSRTEDAADRRIKRLALTEQGRAATARVAAARLAGLERFVEQLGNDTRERLAAALGPLLALLDESPCAATEGGAR